MSKVSTSDFRNGLVLNMDGELYSITEFQHVKPGKGPAFVRTKLKGIVNGKNIDKTWRSGEKAEAIRVENREYQYLYNDGSMFYFMNNDTYEQIPIAPNQVERQDFLIEGQTCKVLFNADDEQVLYAEPPDHLVLTVSQTDPGVKGDTAQGGSKPATLDSGAIVNVPLFIQEGEKIRVDTRTGSYLERAK
ncbi:MAG: elongation factor P [Balneolaceae bacterium]|nr:elongation factor P [Balneolaceae bacterium]